MFNYACTTKSGSNNALVVCLLCFLVCVQCAHMYGPEYIRSAFTLIELDLLNEAIRISLTRRIEEVKSKSEREW